jgi:hypothetical protein
MERTHDSYHSWNCLIIGETNISEFVRIEAIIRAGDENELLAHFEVGHEVGGTYVFLPLVHDTIDLSTPLVSVA